MACVFAPTAGERDDRAVDVCPTTSPHTRAPRRTRSTAGSTVRAACPLTGSEGAGNSRCPKSTKVVRAGCADFDLPHGEVMRADMTFYSFAQRSLWELDGRGASQTATKHQLMLWANAEGSPERTGRQVSHR